MFSMKSSMDLEVISILLPTSLDSDTRRLRLDVISETLSFYPTSSSRSCMLASKLANILVKETCYRYKDVRKNSTSWEVKALS